MAIRSTALVFAALASAALAATVRAQAAQYTITNVGGSQPGTAVGVAGLSDTGMVTGWVITSGGPFSSYGFRWSPGLFLLPDPPAGVAWTAFATYDVNNAGAFVGFFGDLGSSLTRGFRWENGVSTEVFTPLGFRAFPTAINNAGWIVGYAGAQPGGTPGAVMWTPALAPSFVADLSRATDINDHGQIVGWRDDAGGVARGFLYDHGSLTPLGTLDPNAAGNVYPAAIDEHGRVVGISEINGEEHAFLWSSATGMTELPGLGGAHFPPDVAALDINDAGLVLGYAPTSQGQVDVIWSPDGTPTELDPLIPDVGPGKSWPNMLASLHINDAGQISGFAANSILNFQTRTVLLTPATLHASGLAPGSAGVVNTLTVTGATPGLMVALAVDFDDPLDQGYKTLRGCGPLGLAMAAPRVAAATAADASGQATLSWLVPSGLAGAQVRLQVFQRGACALSNVVRVAF